MGHMQIFIPWKLSDNTNQGYFLWNSSLKFLLAYHCANVILGNSSQLKETGNDNDRHVKIKVQIHYSLILNRIFLWWLFFKISLWDCCMDPLKLAFENLHLQFALLVFQQQLWRLMGCITEGQQTILQGVPWKIAWHSESVFPEFYPMINLIIKMQLKRVHSFPQSSRSM